MKTVMLSSVIVTLAASVLVVCRAVPVQPPFSDEKAENDSQDMNEVGPDENWRLYNQISKTQSYDSADEEKTKRLMKEIEEFTRLVSTSQPPPPPSTYYNMADDGSDSTTLENGPETENENDFASSDWFASTWRTQLQGWNDGAISSRQEEGDSGSDDDDSVGNVEEIIKKIRKDLKKLYKKLKEVVKVVKNWVISKKGPSKGEYYDGSFPMSASASESDGVFVIAEPLIGDTDKSNKYTVPIFAD